MCHSSLWFWECVGECLLLLEQEALGPHLWLPKRGRVETTVREKVSPEERHLAVTEVKLGPHTKVSEELLEVDRL